MIIDIPQIVIPRKPHRETLPIISVDLDGKAWSEIDSAATPRGLVSVLTNCNHNRKTGRHPRALLACADPVRIFLKLHRQFKKDPEWNCRVSNHETDHFINGTIEQFDETTINWFGWKDRHRNTCYYYPISPEKFGRLRINELITGDQPEWVKLYEWAKTIQQFCAKNHLRFGSGAGSIAAQFLRDRKFYPAPRRKIPKATNERVRSALPGNHYDLQGRTGILYGSALYLDQHNAHHYAAETVQLPNANELFARGYFESNDRKDPQVWVSAGEPLLPTLLQDHGLFLVLIRTPPHLTGYLPPWASSPGKTLFTWIFSNEIPLMKELGCQIEAIVAAWTASSVDTGLPKYARWAQEQIKQYKHDRQWLKPLLLSTYGVLAAKPRTYHFGYHRAYGKIEEFLLGPEIVHLHHTQTGEKTQLPVANVIHRGMIEAQTRLESIQLARQLEAEGDQVLSIYADGVIVKDSGRQLPLLPHPWRIKNQLKFLQYEDATSFRSNSLCRFPGRPLTKIPAPAMIGA